MEPKVRIIMGIDPGTNYTGYGVLEVRGRTPRCIVLGYIELHKVDDVYQKLRHIFERVSALIDQYHPHEVALESPFFGENVQSMLKLGRAQGVAMAAALMRGLPVFEYAPRRIKQAITGNGAASKEQVATLLKTMLKVEYSLKKLDATDGLAVALCHFFETDSAIKTAAAECGSSGNSLANRLKSQSGKGAKSWESFLASHPDREIKNAKKGRIKADPESGSGSVLDSDSKPTSFSGSTSDPKSALESGSMSDPKSAPKSRPKLSKPKN